jgi:hypothetical protein
VRRVTLPPGAPLSGTSMGGHPQKCGVGPGFSESPGRSLSLERHDRDEGRVGGSLESINHELWFGIGEDGLASVPFASRKVIRGTGWRVRGEET